MFHQYKKCLSVSRSSLVVAFVAFLSACGQQAADSKSEAKNELPAADSNASLNVVTPVASCESLLKFDLTGIGGAGSKITSAAEQTANGKTSCVVEGIMAPAVGFKVKLPKDAWTQRFMQLGCGGLCGMINMNIGAADGCTAVESDEFVLASTDMGHSGMGGDFGQDPQKRIDFAYRGVHITALASKALIEEYYGQPLPEPHAADVTGVEDLIGWHEQGDGKLFLGINIENGRVQDKGDLRIKSALHTLLSQYRMDTRLTALQAIVLCDIDPADRGDIDRILSEHGVKSVENLSLIRRYSIACPAFPTCGLSITESERVLPQLIDQLDGVISELNLEEHKIALHMTGCPNGCARPYTPDIGLVGRSVGKYTMFLGGNAEGTRLAFIYKDQVPLEDIPVVLKPLLTAFREERNERESFGDFCDRLGLEALQSRAA